jgi:hypothetical protein
MGMNAPSCGNGGCLAQLDASPKALPPTEYRFLLRRFVNAATLALGAVFIEHNEGLFDLILATMCCNIRWRDA